MHVAERPVDVGRVDLKDVVVNEVRHVNLALHVGVVGRVCQVPGFGELQEAIPAFTVAHEDIALRNVFRRLQEIGRFDAVVTCQEAAVYALADVIDAPRLTVDEQEGRLTARCVSVELKRQPVGQLVAHQRRVPPGGILAVVPTVVQDQPLE